MTDPIIWPRPVQPPVREAVPAAAVAKALMNSALSHLKPIFTDDHYVALTRAEWSAAFAEGNEKALKYIPTVHDCDDFGALARGLIPALSSVNGIAWVLDPSSQHSYNAVLVKDGTEIEIAVVEPQLGKFEDAGKGHYLGKQGWIIF